MFPLFPQKIITVWSQYCAVLGVLIRTEAGQQPGHSFWSQHEGKTRDMTPTRMMLKLKLNASVVLPTMIFSIIMMFDLLYRGRKTVKCKYSASISDRPQIRRDGGDYDVTVTRPWPVSANQRPVWGIATNQRPVWGIATNQRPGEVA